MFNKKLLVAPLIGVLALASCTKDENTVQNILPAENTVNTIQEVKPVTFEMLKTKMVDEAFAYALRKSITPVSEKINMKISGRIDSSVGTANLKIVSDSTNESFSGNIDVVATTSEVGNLNSEIKGGANIDLIALMATEKAYFKINTLETPTYVKSGISVYGPDMFNDFVGKWLSTDLPKDEMSRVVALMNFEKIKRTVTENFPFVLTKDYGVKNGYATFGYSLDKQKTVNLISELAIISGETVTEDKKNQMMEDFGKLTATGTLKINVIDWSEFENEMTLAENGSNVAVTLSFKNSDSAFSSDVKVGSEKYFELTGTKTGDEKSFKFTTAKGMDLSGNGTIKGNLVKSEYNINLVGKDGVKDMTATIQGNYESKENKNIKIVAPEKSEDIMSLTSGAKYVDENEFKDTPTGIYEPIDPNFSDM